MLNHCRTKIVTLVFKRSELLYDIENYAYVEGDIMPGQATHGRHQTMDIGQDGNVDRVTRVLDLAHSECENMLYPYTRFPSRKCVVQDDILMESKCYIIRMRVPEDFSKTTIDMLTHFIHEYMVCRVLGDWLSITNPQSSASWERKIAYAKSQIQSCKNFRTGRVRRKQTPF